MTGTVDRSLRVAHTHRCWQPRGWTSLTTVGRMPRRTDGSEVRTQGGAGSAQGMQRPPRGLMVLSRKGNQLKPHDRVRGAGHGTLGCIP